MSNEPLGLSYPSTRHSARGKPHEVRLQTFTIRLGSAQKAIALHEGAEADARAIFACEEYDLRKIGFSEVTNIVDIGAHVGLFALFMRAAFAAARIHCFEPLPINLPLLRCNVADDPAIIVNPYGLSSYRHETEIWLSPNFGHGAASTFRTHDHSGESQPVSFAVAAEALAAIEGRLSILKIDTEGHELRILRNIVPHFGRIDGLFLEVHSGLALAHILGLLNPAFIPVHFGGGMGNRYKVAFASRAGLAEGRVRAMVAPEIYYD